MTFSVMVHLCMEPLKGHGDGKNMRLYEKLYFNAIAISHKTSAFPGEGLRLLAKLL